MAPLAAPLAQRFWAKVDPDSGAPCWTWVGSFMTTGYGYIVVGHDTKIPATHLAWALTFGPIPGSLWALHHCDTPACVNPDHLWLGDHNDNMRDMAAKGRQVSGERSNLARLTKPEVEAIRRLYGEGGVSQRGLARAFGVSQPTVSLIVSGRTWDSRSAA